MKHSVSELRLTNGARGLLIHIPDASVMTFDFNFRAGEYLVERSIWETPHIMEHMLLGANQMIPKSREFQAEFEKNGAYCNASTSSYDINYEAECADFEWDRVLGLMLVAITKPLFLRDEFKAEFGNVREELTSRSNNHSRQLSLNLREAYGYKAMTDHQRLKIMSNVKLQDVQQHYLRTHTSSNLRFVIAGNINIERRKQIRSLFSSIELDQGLGRELLPEETPRFLGKPLYINNPTVDNLYFFMDTFRNHRLTDPETDALNLLNTMLTETLYSRILGTARERGLVYNVNSGISETSTTSNWWFGAQVMPKNAPALFDIIIKALHDVLDGDLSDQDVQAAKQYAIGRYQRSAQTVAGTAYGYMNDYYFDGSIQDYYQVPARIKAITKQRIIKVAASMFADKVWGLGCLGNAGEQFTKELYKQLSALW